jgi:hypothetical protein
MLALLIVAQAAFAANECRTIFVDANTPNPRVLCTQASCGPGGSGTCRGTTQVNSQAVQICVLVWDPNLNMGLGGWKWVNQGPPLDPGTCNVTYCACRIDDGSSITMVGTNHCCRAVRVDREEGVSMGKTGYCNDDCPPGECHLNVGAFNTPSVAEAECE